jgi:hypothetical protein
MIDRIKRSKKDGRVKYRDYPKEDERCGLCRMFISPNECSAVAGAISKNGWCRLWEARRK